MAKNKKEKTIKQQARSLGRWKNACIFGEFLSFLTPFFIIAIVNKDKYFVEHDGTKISIGFFLAMAVMGFGLIGILNQKIKNTYIIFIIKWIAILLSFALLVEIISDIVMIMAYGLIGIIVGFGLDETSKGLEKKRQKKLKAIETAKMNADVAQAEKEL